MTTVLICDDRHQVRDNLARVLSRAPSIARIWRIEHHHLLPTYARYPADLVLVATEHASTAGVTAIRQLLAVHDRVNVLAFGAPRDTGSVAAAIAAGANGFLRWDSSRSEVVATISRAVENSTIGTAPSRPDGHQELRLTSREMQVLQGMSKGFTNSQMGQNLFLSEDTIKTHARRLFRKLGVSDRAEAVAHGFRHHLIS